MPVTFEDILNLKNLILEPGYADREGRTGLDQRADKNRLPGTDKEKELEIVLGLLDDLSAFRSSNVSILLAFIKRSDLAEETVARKILRILAEQPDKLDVLKKAELIRFVLDIIPAQVSEDFIGFTLKQLIKSRPWLYAEILSRKNPRESVKIIESIILSGGYTYSPFYHLFSQWMQIPDIQFLRWMGDRLAKVLDDEKAISILKRKLNDKGIEIRQDEVIMVNEKEFVNFKTAVAGWA